MSGDTVHVPTSTTQAAASKGPHRKSRTGCLECKKRRIKCDERRPQCRRCAIGSRQCGYAVHASRLGTSDGDGHPVATIPPLSNRSGNDTSLSASSPYENDGQSSRAPPALPDAFSLLHMRLLNHAITHMASYMALETDVQPIIDYALHSTNPTPYLLSQLLALSALHCSVQQPEMAAEFQYYATDLQNRALSAFGKIENSSPQPESAPVPSFIFAALLGNHVLHDCLAREQDSVGAFVADFVRYARVHRGVRSVIGTHWDEITASPLKPLLYISRWIQDNEGLPKGTETGPLTALLGTLLDQSSVSIKATLEALQFVQWMLDLQRIVPTNSARCVQVTLAWPLVVPEVFFECLHQHRPEALAVLAFFGASLHQQESFWVFGKAGRRLVRLIVDHIGPFWRDALAWPREVIVDGGDFV